MEGETPLEQWIEKSNANREETKIEGKWRRERQVISVGLRGKRKNLCQHHGLQLPSVGGLWPLPNQIKNINLMLTRI